VQCPTRAVCGCTGRAKHDSPSAPAGRDGARGEDDEDDVFMRDLREKYGSATGFKLKF
jgi:hypothetical protein